MSKHKAGITLSFPGTAAEDVTGSMVLVRTPTATLLIEAGLTQTGSPAEDWKTNTRRLPFKPSHLDYIFLGHCHADHALLIPRLYAMGCRATIVAPIGTRELFRIMGNNSASILSGEAQCLSRQKKRAVRPYYAPEDVAAACEHIVEYPCGEVYCLRDNLRFRFTPSGHILHAAQLELWLWDGSREVKIGYSSDLGSSIPRRFVEAFRPIRNCDVFIGECTYAMQPSVQTKDRAKDVERIKHIVRSACIDQGGVVLIPSFSLDRTQNLLCVLHEIFGSDHAFTVPVVLDSPLSMEITHHFIRAGSDTDSAALFDALRWKNVVCPSSAGESREWMRSRRPCVVLASAGMMNAGRSRLWAKELLPRSNCHILFCGYSSEASLATQIKNARKGQKIKIDKERIPARCGVTCLRSFSAHMSHDDLLDYYASINARKIVLVHGDGKRKVQFAHVLQERIEAEGHTTRVVCANSALELRP